MPSARPRLLVGHGRRTGFSFGSATYHGGAGALRLASQDWGATDGVPSGVTVALKNGFSIIDGWQINTEGSAVGLGRNYVIAVLTDHNPSEDYGIQTVDGVSALVWQALGG